MADSDDIQYLKRTLTLAARARGKTSPNPMVGAVVVKNGKIFGEGYHRKAGTPHAEIHALKAAGNKARGADLYINLEPCCHTGRTGPCTDAIIESGIKRVVYAMPDPNPKVKGKGKSRLKKAGIEVNTGILEDKARELNEKYIKYITTGKPFVTLKLAQTLDGKIATLSGESQWITGQEARRMGHRLRAEHDAVAVGGMTAAKDNPSLTVRHVRGENPYRIIISEKLKFQRNLSLFAENRDRKTIVVTSRKASTKKLPENLEVWKIRSLKQGLSLNEFLKQAGDFGISSILLEGGAGLAAAFIRAGLIDKYVIFIAPRILGQGLNSISDLGIKKLAKTVMLTDLKTRKVGHDLMLTGYPKG